MKLDQIGRGGSSKVYRVVSPNWTTYALKYVPLKNTDTVTEESYLNEIDLLKKLSHHDNIIRLVDSEVRTGAHLSAVSVAFYCGVLGISLIHWRFIRRHLSSSRVCRAGPG